MFDSSVTLHSGASIPESANFKTSPPNSIGTLRSIQSVAQGTPGVRSFIDWLTLPLILGPTLIAIAFALGLLHIYVLGAIVAMVVITMCFRRPNSIETFVGDLGIARMSHYGRGGHEETTTELLAFKDVTELRYAIRDFYSHMSYRGSNFVFRWLNGNGQVVFSTQGAFYRTDDGISEENNYFFSLAAGNAWNSFLTTRLTDEVKTTGECCFRVFDQDQIAVGDSYLECTFAGKSTRLLPEDVSVLAMSGGVLHIETHTKKWYERGRICRINCGRISNLDHLLRMMEEYGGFTFIRE